MQTLGSESFWRKIKNFSRAEQKKVFRIVTESKNGAVGLDNIKVPDSLLPIRNKKSTDVDANDPQFMKKIMYANEHNLWHIHAGFHNNSQNEYPIDNGYKESKKNDLVSQWMLHYRNDGGKVKFVDATVHPLDIFSIKTG